MKIEHRNDTLTDAGPGHYLKLPTTSDFSSIQAPMTFSRWSAVKQPHTHSDRRLYNVGKAIQRLDANAQQGQQWLAHSLLLSQGHVRYSSTTTAFHRSVLLCGRMLFFASTCDWTTTACASRQDDPLVAECNLYSVINKSLFLLPSFHQMPSFSFATCRC